MPAVDGVSATCKGPTIRVESSAAAGQPIKPPIDIIVADAQGNRFISGKAPEVPV